MFEIPSFCQGSGTISHPGSSPEAGRAASGSPRPVERSSCTTRKELRWFFKTRLRSDQTFGRVSFPPPACDCLPGQSICTVTGPCPWDAEPPSPAAVHSVRMPLYECPIALSLHLAPQRAPCSAIHIPECKRLQERERKPEHGSLKVWIQGSVYGHQCPKDFGKRGGGDFTKGLQHSR